MAAATLAGVKRFVLAALAYRLPLKGHAGVSRRQESERREKTSGAGFPRICTTRLRRRRCRDLGPCLAKQRPGARGWCVRSSQAQGSAVAPAARRHGCGLAKRWHAARLASDVGASDDDDVATERCPMLPRSADRSADPSLGALVAEIGHGHKFRSRMHEGYWRRRRAESGTLSAGMAVQQESRH